MYFLNSGCMGKDVFLVVPLEVLCSEPLKHDYPPKANHWRTVSVGFLTEVDLMPLSRWLFFSRSNAAPWKSVSEAVLPSIGWWAHLVFRLAFFLVPLLCCPWKPVNQTERDTDGHFFALGVGSFG